jgi:hypothetical protein
VTAELGTDWLTLPEGARWLTREELDRWKSWLDADWMRWGFLWSFYARPQDVDLGELFYNGVDLGENASPRYAETNPVTDGDRRYWLSRTGNLSGDLFKCPGDQMDALLRKYLGLGLEDTRRVGLSWLYDPETNTYYNAHLNGNFRTFSLLYGYTRGNEICLFTMAPATYVDPRSGTKGFNSGTDGLGVFRTVLRQEGDSVRFVSHLRALTDGTGEDYDIPRQAEACPAGYDPEQDVTVISPRVWEDFDSAEAAQASIDGISHTIGDTTYTYQRLREWEYPGYGTLVYGEIGDGGSHGPDVRLFFVTPAGRRYELDVPGYSMGEYRITDDWAQANEGRACMFEMVQPAGAKSWWMNCVYETYIGGGQTRKGGMCTWTLYFPTLEIFAWFRPDGTY